MLIVEDNSVYEIDEECIQRKKVPPECGTAEKLQQRQRRQEPTRRKKDKNMWP